MQKYKQDLINTAVYACLALVIGVASSPAVGSGRAAAAAGAFAAAAVLGAELALAWRRPPGGPHPLPAGA